MRKQRAGENVLLAMGASLRFAVSLFICIGVSLDSALQPVMGDAEVAKRNDAQDKVCIGYDKVSAEWGWNHYRDKEWLHCAANHAFFGVAVPGSSGIDKAEDVTIVGNCCELPYPDILTEHHVITNSTCPDGFVVTGAEVRTKCDVCMKRLRCTAINSEKYLLGKPQGGIFWGIGTRVSFPWDEKRKIRRNQLPLAIRYGLTRIARHHFRHAGCVGDPIGSLLVGKTNPNCEDLLWSELFFKKGTDDNGSPERVKMFPDCAQIHGILHETGKCIKASSYTREQGEVRKNSD